MLRVMERVRDSDGQRRGGMLRVVTRLRNSDGLRRRG